MYYNMHLECWARIYKHIHTSLYNEHMITKQKLVLITLLSTRTGGRES